MAVLNPQRVEQRFAAIEKGLEELRGIVREYCEKVDDLIVINIKDDEDEEDEESRPVPVPKKKTTTRKRA
jgi:hypothetical protein